MQANSLTLSVVAELTIKNDLKERLHHLWHGAVKLVQHNDDGLAACTNIPTRQAKGSYSELLAGLEVRNTGHLRFVHG